MSALLEERGLRTAERNAEPQVVGLAPQTTVMTERANTMKTYILRDPNRVEPQKAPPAKVGRGMFGRGMPRLYSSAVHSPANPDTPHSQRGDTRWADTLEDDQGWNTKENQKRQRR